MDVFVERVFTSLAGELKEMLLGADGSCFCSLNEFNKFCDDNAILGEQGPLRRDFTKWIDGQKDIVLCSGGE